MPGVFRGFPGLPRIAILGPQRRGNRRRGRVRTQSALGRRFILHHAAPAIHGSLAQEIVKCEGIRDSAVREFYLAICPSDLDNAPTHVDFEKFIVTKAHAVPKAHPAKLDIFSGHSDTFRIPSGLIVKPDYVPRREHFLAPLEAVDCPYLLACTPKVVGVIGRWRSK
jgi:hypothetical protein